MTYVPYTSSSQELVNLLLTGVAVSNVFDGDMELSGKGSDKVSIQGPSVGG